MTRLASSYLASLAWAKRRWPRGRWRRSIIPKQGDGTLSALREAYRQGWEDGLRAGKEGKL